MEITIVCPDISENALGRSVTLARLAERFADDVEICGYASKGEVWEPCQGLSDLKIIHRALPRKSVCQERDDTWLYQRCRSRVVILSKPREYSLGLHVTRPLSEYVVLDIDDWEAGLAMRAKECDKNISTSNMWYWPLLQPAKLLRFRGLQKLETQVSGVEHVIVSNQWLQQQFGGVVIPHARADDGSQAQGEYAKDLADAMDPNRVWFGFVGTMRGHKGVDDLIRAVARLRGSKAPGLLLAGASQEDKNLLKLAEKSLSPERLVVRGRFPYDEISEVVSQPDVLVTPSRRTPGSIGQIPAKLVDALAAGKPVVVSDVGDMPAYAKDGGLVIPPGDIEALSEAIDTLAGDAQLREKCSEGAYEYFQRHLSEDVLTRRLRRVLELAISNG